MKILPGIFRIEVQPDEKWLAQRQQILAEFEKKTIQISRQDSSDITTTQPKRIKKESLTKSININVASFEELQILPRIGPATAQKIIAFREQHGPFSTIEEIQHVKNIGPRTFENIKDYITVD